MEKISDIGSHDELMLSSTTYQRLYRLQFHDSDMPADAELSAREVVGEKA